MAEFINKVSSYHLFNYLFVGVLFVVLAKLLTPYSFVQQDILLGVFLYYFIGLIVSRIGSLVIEPILKYIKFVKFSDYSLYVSASQSDSTLEVLSEVNNMYRSIVAVCLSIIFLKLYNLIEIKYIWTQTYQPYILMVVVLVLFLSAYKKQTKYITKRININR